MFADLGSRMQNLLRHAVADGIGGDYARRVLSAFDNDTAKPAVSPRSAAAPYGQLTPREVEVLRLIAAGMRNQEIADQLFISLPTVKRHVANTYRKLDVAHRTEAVVKARELDLL